MDTRTAFALGAAAMAVGDRVMVFDWEKAARLIAGAKPDHAAAGLAGDWEWTGGSIWGGGKPVPRAETYTFLASNWAEPQLRLDGVARDCWRYRDETPGWDSDTYWPPEALAIVGLP